MSTSTKTVTQSAALHVADRHDLIRGSVSRRDGVVSVDQAAIRGS